MASSAKSDSSKDPKASCDPSKVLTRLFQPNGDVAPAEYERLALTEAEVAAAILIREN